MTSVEFFIPSAKAGVDKGTSSVAGYPLWFPRCLPFGKKLPGPRSSHDRGPLPSWFRQSTPRVRSVPAASGGMTLSRPPVGGDDVDLSSRYGFKKQRDWMIGHRNTAKSAHGPWRLRQSPALAIALPARYFVAMGLPNLVERSTEH